MSKVYISGPITGRDPGVVRKRFKQVMTILQEEGLEPVSPLENGLPDSATWSDHMKENIRMMMQCDSVAFMSNWPVSRGCRVEYKLAENLGMRIIYLGRDNQLLKK